MRIYVHILLVALVLLGCSCSREDAPDYDRLKIQLLTEAFEAVHQRDHELAVSRLEKLQETEFINQLILFEKENMTLSRISQHLNNREMAKAEKVLNDGIVSCGTTPRMREAQQQVQGLKTIQNYSKKLPFDDSEDAMTELKKLPEAILFDGSKPYVAWIGKQQAMVDELKRVERVRLEAELLSELDLALVRGSSQTPVVIARLHYLIPDHPALAAKLPDTKSQPLVHDIVCFRLAQSGNPALLREVLRLYRTRPAGSFCGRHLRCWAALESNMPVSGLQQLRELQADLTDLDYSSLLPRIHAITDKAFGRQAPSMPNLLQALLKMQDTPTP